MTARHEAAVGPIADVQLLDGSTVTGVLPAVAAVATPTQVSFPGKAVLRTVVQVGIPSFLALAAFVPIIIDAILGSVPASVRLWLLGVSAGITAFAAGLAKAMTNPVVNAWLQRFGLAAQPKPTVVQTELGGPEGDER